MAWLAVCKQEGLPHKRSVPPVACSSLSQPAHVSLFHSLCNPDAASGHGRGYHKAGPVLHTGGPFTARVPSFP